MKLKSLLFGSAAALMAVTGAQAAEPLEPIAEPVDYVRICDAFGTGFFYIPGTDTCLKIGGYVRADFHYTHPFDGVVVLNEPFDVIPFGGGATVTPQITGPNPRFGFIPVNNRNFNEFTSRARARLTLDSRTQTDIGMVRTFTDLWFTIGPGNSAVASSGGTLVRQAMIQIANDWGTVTVGRAPSFFEFFEGNAWASIFGDDAPLSPVNQAAVTFNLGGGVSGTLAIEDPDSDARRVGFGGSAFFPMDTNFDGIPDVIATPGGFGGGFFPTFADQVHGGQRAPDVVANLRVDQAWGSAQVMAALHPIRATAFSGTVPGGGIFTPFSDQEPSTELGWAVGAGAEFGLPAAGLTFAFQAAYADGAIDYITTGNGGPRTDAIVVDRFGPGGVPDGITDGVETSEAWSIHAGVGGNLAPDWSWNLEGSFARVDLPDVGAAAAVTATTCPHIGISAVQTCAFDPASGTFTAGSLISSDYDTWTASGRVAWEPVAGFVSGVEVAYEKVDFDHGGEVDRWGGMWRTQKSF